MTDELAKCEAALRRMEDTQSENQYLVHELNGMKKRLLSFEEFAKDAQPEALFTLVHSIVDRIYITTDGTKQKCQVYIKGCATEDYSDVLGAAGYIEEEPLLPVVSYMPPMCDLDYYSITIEQIDRDTFSISEYKHWEETHCYLLCGEKYAVLIDTGLGVSNIRKIVDSLTELPVVAVTTHVHWDHIGGHKYFDNIAVHEAEKDWLSVRFPIPLQVVKNNLTRLPCDFPRDFDINAYQIFQGMPQRILHDGNFLNLGGREIQVIHTPGHSPGHCCFYEPERNYLYSGDLIYKGSLDAFYPTTDPHLFYQSIRRIRKYNIKKVLPGHHQLDIPVS